MTKFVTKTQVSAGGVAFRRQDDQIEIALISVGADNRWQLPKGLVGKHEAADAAAQREVREETGLETELIELIDKIEYWYVTKAGNLRVRYHKFVYFYLLRYQAGNVTDHDHEVNEARWVNLDEALQMLAFDNEKKVVDQAKSMIESLVNN
jgi:8-oxo-dGTP pyrophosphatase MutT (NUDIX family)